MYYSDMEGALHVTNDGINHKVVFPADGVPCRAIAVSGPNIIMVKKQRLYYSSNNGVNFNIGYDSVRADLIWDSTSVCNRYTGALNQSMLLDAPDHNAVYVAATPLINPPFGSAVAFSQTHATRGIWALKLLDTTGAHVGTRPDAINSMTRLKNGTMIGYHYLTNRFYYDVNKPYQGVGWQESTGNTAGLPGVGDPERQTGTGLPTTDTFTIGHINNRLIAGSLRCTGFVMYSDDSGRNWLPFNTIANAPVLCIAAPFEQFLLIGTHGGGLWILNQHTNVLQQAKNGLPANLIVRNAVGKEVTYRNDVVQQYMYIATNLGIYQSKDGGLNWTLTIKGDFGCIY